ncbi:ComEA family DNA-binding protein [Noviherbaspirillum denitrificans]|uniref:DNA uptake protein n=1 Tax=Noviherbaspirillum denitrificans TaxID=1968433 RepID=A0A254TCQ5_9BURK|nr:helix-hairpin-helix domain-containing protein [Noviherbaspirillum denitrificans]OWW20420.1 hypothetical protein AYR66_13925 [Noviherbaspirillum denitrificans]
MLKRLLFMFAALWMSVGLAFAQVDVNTADASALDSIKGIGPKISKTIVDERNKNGKFKDWNDFESRVKGIGDKSATKMSEAGLTIDGKSKPGTTTASKQPKTSASSAAATSSSSPSGNKAARSSGASMGSDGSAASGKGGSRTDKKSQSGASPAQ